MSLWTRSRRTAPAEAPVSRPGWSDARHAADVAAHAAHVALTNGATIEEAQDAYAAAYLAEIDG